MAVTARVKTTALLTALRVRIDGFLRAGVVCGEPGFVFSSLSLWRHT